eukprot:2659046-Prorocentrum_lima.AAC.1
MTSSLVGSEMCIRDRAELSSEVQRGGYVPHHVCFSDGRLRAGHRPGTVSYTHLTLPTICSV